MENKEIKRITRPESHDCNRLSNVNEIARGGFSIIYKATWIDGRIDTWSIGCNGEYKREGTVEVAIKIIKTNSEEVFKELNIGRAIFINTDDKDNFLISEIIGITQNTETLEYGIVLPFAKFGDMRKYLSTNFHSTSWYDKLWIARTIAKGLDDIHSSGLVHRDLHSGNILQMSTHRANIGDLGLCQPVNHEATTTTTDPTTGKDMKEKRYMDYGMLLWELSTGKPPFYDCKHDHILIMAILNGQRPKITFPLIPPSIAKLIEECWDPNPKNRPTAEKIGYKLMELESNYIKIDYYTDEELTAEEFIDQEPTDEESIEWESKTLSLQFRESEKYVKKMAESDDSTTTNQSTTTMTTTTTRIHPGAVYTSRVLTLQMIQETKELVFLPKDDA
ncbi:hypothetical protein G9A89_004427 [Geosiphon pyriformis]|nr:hypothetical protein G9A89_004427 [Geosiphon pyriformis]